MKGTVKWFSEEKGYGFIVGDDGIERYFGVKAIIGAELPKNGATILFDHSLAQKGPRAENIQIISQPVANHRDDRTECPSCRKRIVPRIITDRGVLSHSVCPFCGETVNNFGSTFGSVLTIIIIVIFALAFFSR